MITIEQSTKLRGVLTANGRTVKEFNTDVDENAISVTSEFLLDKDLYNKNRKQMRKDEKTYYDKVRALEDEILAKLEEDDEEEVPKAEKEETEEEKEE